MKKSSAFRLSLDAVFIALYVVFSVYLAVKAGNVIEISWASLPILVCAFLFDPWDAIAVAVCGSFLEQLLSYGIAATMPLWMLPVILQAAFASLAVRFLLKNGDTVRKSVVMIVLIVISELLLTFANIGASLADAYLLDYLEYMTIDVPVRLLNGGVRAVISAIVIPLLIPRLKAALHRP